MCVWIKETRRTSRRALDVVKGRIFEPPVFFSPSFQSVCKANANRLLATASRSARRNVKVLLIFSSYSWQEKASEPIFFFFFLPNHFFKARRLHNYVYTAVARLLSLQTHRRAYSCCWRAVEED